jgi:orotate phosphoribosyltransferase
MENNVLEILKKTGAVLDNDHFVGTSGGHFDTYVNKDALYPHTKETSAVCQLFAEKYKDLDIDVVAGPALGGIILSQWTAYHLSQIKGKEILGVYAEKEDDKLTFFTRRNYNNLIKGKKVLALEDLTQTGSSLKKLVEAIKEAGGEVIQASVMVNKNPQTINTTMFGVPFSSLAEMTIANYSAEECPLCKNNVPINTKIGHGKKFLESKQI